MKRLHWLFRAACALIAVWFVIGIWLLVNSQDEKIKRTIPAVQFPVESMGVTCNLRLNEATFDLILPLRLPAGKGNNAADLVIKPNPIPYEWLCSDLGAEAVVEESLQVYLSSRLTIPEWRVIPADRIAQPINDSFAKRFRWEFELNQSVAERKAEIWIGIYVLTAEAPIHDVLSGNTQPVERWLWTIEEPQINAFSTLGLTYHSLVTLMFGCLALGILLLIAYALLRWFPRQKIS